VALTLHQIRLFVALAKRLNMTEISKEMHLTQPAISHQIKNLEREFGKTFFQSQGRGVKLTRDGAKFLRKAESILSSVNEMYRRYGAKR